MNLIIIGLLLLLLTFGLKYWFLNTQSSDLRKQLSWVGLTIGLFLLVFLLLTGRLAWIWAAGVAALPWILRILRIGQFINAIRNLRGGGSAQNAEARSRPDSAMTPEKAAEILGLTLPTTEDEIKEAHKNLMKRNHPDHGGSDYFAQLLNQARDVLLDRLS